MNDNTFEQYPGEKLNNEPSEADLARANEWQSAMSAEDTPAFAGDDFFTQETVPSESTEAMDPKDNEGLSSASAIINYGLNAAAKEYGVETVVQKIKDFDASGSANPIRDLFLHLGVEIPAGLNEVRLERETARPDEADFYANSEAAPATINRSQEGALQAILDMKELISEVEGADPRYEDLRQGAKSAGKGYFEYAVGSEVNRGLTDLFDALAAEPKEETQLPQDTLESEENIEKSPE